MIANLKSYQGILLLKQKGKLQREMCNNFTYVKTVCTHRQSNIKID